VSTILDEILAHKREEVSARQARQPAAALQAALADAPSPRAFAAALTARMDRGEPAVIAEIKKASPSRGVIRADFDPPAIARSYAAAGAACLSVLTDVRYFQGHDDCLRAARAACALPVLRKDFVVDEYQLLEARALGADCVLLIVAALDAGQLKALHDGARELGLDVLLEVHDARELATALTLEPRLVGINNRDLRSFETRLDTTLELLPQIPPEVAVITESGIHSVDDVAAMRNRGVHGFLVGEAFMRAADPGAALQSLFFG